MQYPHWMHEFLSSVAGLFNRIEFFVLSIQMYFKVRDRNVGLLLQKRNDPRNLRAQEQLHRRLDINVMTPFEVM